MWFRNLHLYQLTTPFQLSPEALAEKLEEKRFAPCGRQSEESMGWVSPIHRSRDYLVHAASGAILLCMRREQKVIPASAIKETLEERIQAIELDTGRKVYSKEKQSLKDDVLSQMLPNAFVRSSHTFAYIDSHNGFFVIDASSDKTADSVYELLTESIGSFGAVKLVAKDNPALLFNSWLRTEFAEGWEATGVYELKDPGDERVAKFKDNEEQNPVLEDLLEDGYWVSKLGFRFNGQFKGVIQPDLVIKGVKFSDELLAENEDVNGEDDLVRFDADFALMTRTLADFFTELSEIFEVNVAVEKSSESAG